MINVDRMQTKTDQPSIPYISLFSGAGGFDLGLEAVGYEARACVDLDFHSCRTLAFNRALGRRTGFHRFLNKAVVLNQDLRRISTSKLLNASRLRPGEVPLVVGGPPCQSFSVFGGRRGMDDPRGLLWMEFARVVRELRPNAFLFENVAGLLTVDGGRHIHRYSTFCRIEAVTRNTKFRLISLMLRISGYPSFERGCSFSEAGTAQLSRNLGQLTPLIGLGHRSFRDKIRKATTTF